MTDSDAHKPGLRGRIRTPAPPAPVPASRPPTETRPAESAPDLSRVTRNRVRPGAASGHPGSSRPPGATAEAGAAAGPRSAPQTAVASVSETGATPATRGAQGEPARTSGAQSDTDVVASTGSMALATLISRLTGFLRNLLIGATLGPAIASAFNVANTLPNLITEIVLGAVLTSLVVPVLVRAEKEDPDQGAAFIRRLLTVSITLLAVVTVLAVAAAPLLTALGLNTEGKVNVPLATAFAFLLLPQIIFYGVFALLMAVLNTKGIFKPGAWAPVANNVIAIATLLLYWTLPGRIDPDSPGSLSDPHILLLGVGTTLGVVVQALIMVPYLRRAGIDLRPLWGIDDRIKQFSGMGIAIVTYVAISQAGYFITTNIASTADEAAPTIYQQAWLLLQVPYGIIGVTLLTAIMPRLSRNAADGNDRAVVRDLSVGTRLTMIALVPIVAFFTAFGRPIAIGLFAYLEFPQETAEILGWTLSFSAFSLIPYAIVLLHLRVFYAREEAWTPTFIILGITAVKVILSFLAPILASELENVVVLLAAANGFGFLAGAVIGFLLLRRQLGHLDSRATVTTMLWSLGASAVGVAVASVVYFLSDLSILDVFGSFGFLIRTAITGVVFLVATGVVLAKAPLAEVAVIGGLLARIPGLRRFGRADAQAIAPDVADREAMQKEKGFGADAFSISPTSLIGEQTGLANEGFTASPLLPPMPTQGSRPTRFVPGEIVSSGRFRLRSEVATYSGLRLWRATDQGDPDHNDVALIFVDTIALPNRGTSPTEAADAIAARTNALRGLGGTDGLTGESADATGAGGMTRLHSVAKTRTEVLIAAEWVSSVAIDSVGANPHPDALALTVAYLADTVAEAHATGRVLGLDNKPERLRLSGDGRLYYAFPVVLPAATVSSDIAALLRLSSSLFDGLPRVPEDITAAFRKAAAAPVTGEVSPAQILADELRAAALGPDSQRLPKVTTDTDSRHLIKSRAGKAGGADASEQIGGGAGTSRRRTRAFSTGAAVVGAVIIGAVVAGSVFGLLNRSENAPITSESVRRGPENAQKAAEETLGTVISPIAAQEWQAANANPDAGADNPQLAALTVDADPQSFWMSSNYYDQFGSQPGAFKPGVGIKVNLGQAVRPSSVRIVGTSGATVEIRGVTTADPTTVAETTLLGSGRLDGSDLVVDAGGVEYEELIIWVTALPTAQQAVAGTSPEGGAAAGSSEANELSGDPELARVAPEQLVPVAIGDIKVRV